MSFMLYPAIDVREGCVVRLRQGDYAQEMRYDDTPLSVARRYAEQGACWVHLVDLDAARFGGYTLLPLLQSIKQATGLQVQTGGGIRQEGDVERLLSAGADRVVVGSLAVEQPAQVRGWLQHFGSEHLIVAMDARRDAHGNWRLPSRGWTTDSGVGLASLLDAFAGFGLRHLLCTDIGRDGMLSGPNVALYTTVLQAFPGLRLQASGGVRDVADVIAVRDAGCSGAVLGKALLDGCFALDDAIAEACAC